jgi:hypothetical protein
MQEISTHLDNIRSCSIVENFDLGKFAISAFSDAATLQLAKQLIPKCTSVELVDFSTGSASPVGDLLQLIDHSKLEHLNLQSPDAASIIDFFSLRKGKPLPKLQMLHVGFALYSELSDPIPIVYALSQMTGQLQQAEIHTRNRDGTSNEALHEVFHRLRTRS